MNTRTIVLIFALLTLISTATGGHLYYHSVQKSAVKETERDIAQVTEELKQDIAGLISVGQNEVRTMSWFERIQKALLNQDPATLSQANTVLDHFAEGFAHDVCYLMDSSGKTIASSNRNNKDSFVGHNYSFRPYFTDAIKGKPGIYMALGLTSGLRGFFVSHPVYSAGGGKPIGVVVIKVSARDLDREFSKKRIGITLLVHSSGIIFASSHENLILKLFSKHSPEELLRIEETRQFGKGPWNWSGFEEKADNKVVDSSGEVYLIQETDLSDCPGWKIVSLYSLRSIYEKIDALVGEAGYVALLLFLLVGGAVIVLYVMAQRDNTHRKLTEDRLQKSEEKYRNIFNNSGVGIFRSKLDGSEVLEVNDKFLKILNQTREEVIGKPSAILWVDPHEREEMVRRLNADGKVTDFEYRMLTTQGEERTCLTSLTIYPDQGILDGSITDITERKRIEENILASEQRLRAITNSAFDAIILINDRGEISCWNPACERIFGYSDSEVMGKDLHELLVPPEFHAAYRPAFKDFVTSGRGNALGKITPLVARRKDGEEFPIDLSLSGFQADGRWQAAGIVRDTTERKRLEEEKENLIIELQKSLSEIKQLSRICM
ncbi:MAG: PAS domain S-box protein [Desulfomonilaceae bacterium]